MLKNYITIALRKFSREKLYVSINILSLALGIASFLILALYLRSELTYDQHHVNHKRIYRLNTHWKNAEGRVDNFAVSQIGIGPMLVTDFPQLGQQVRFRLSQQAILKYKDIGGKWDDIYFADPAVFDVFTHKIIYGDVKTAFNSPYSIAISESFAKHYFGDENPIGKKLSRANLNFAVTLVFADLPENTHLKYSALFPMSLMQVFDPNFSKSYENTLFNIGIFTYVMTPPNFDPEEFGALTKAFVERHMREKLGDIKMSFEATFQPLDKMHFGEPLQSDLLTGNTFYLYGFAAVAIFILLIACINYMNLATARATKRAKEVGMRKVLGASQAQLIVQFLGESFTFTVIAALVGLLLAEGMLALTPIGSLMGKEHLFAAMGEPLVLLSLVGLVVLVGFVAGLYPAFYLSAISPLAALTQVRRSWRTGLSMRQILVLLQLLISIGVIACTLLMRDQMRFVHEMPLGFDKENRLIVTLRGYDVVKNIKTIKKELRAQTNVLDVTTIDVVPGTGNFVNVMPVENDNGTFESTSTDRIKVGINFVDAMRLKLVEGRGFSEEISTDAREAVIVNESFVKKMGWSEALGKRLKWGPIEFVRVIGVVKDFHYTSLHNAIGPMMMDAIVEDYSNVPDLQKPFTTTSIIVVMNGESLSSTLDAVKSVISKFDPKFDFEPVFLDDKLNELYKSESSLMKLTGVFSGICIFISVMGLFALAAFTTEQRTKEIGIRMVLGASDSQIVTMLSRYLLPLVLIAALPASILSYYAIEKWLQRFVYHTEISWLIFVESALVVAAVALLTVVLQSLKTTKGDPIKALRYE